MNVLVKEKARCEFVGYRRERVQGRTYLLTVARYDLFTFCAMTKSRLFGVESVELFNGSVEEFAVQMSIISSHSLQATGRRHIHRHCGVRFMYIRRLNDTY